MVRDTRHFYALSCRSGSASLSGGVLGPFWDAPGTLREGFWEHSGGFFPRKSIAKTLSKIFEKILREILGWVGGMSRKAINPPPFVEGLRGVLDALHDSE